jgi:FAD/FMN-containing dehydrogenase
MSDPALLDDLRHVLGPDGVRTDPAALALAASDLWTTGSLPRAVVRPSSAAAVAATVRIARAHGCRVIPRGGGLSYTGGYVPPDDRIISVDLAGLNRILRIAPEDLTITVESGATWRDIDLALRPHRLRVPFFGTFSGAAATVGGGVSHGALFFGSARYGAAADQVLGLQVALADGSLLQTGCEAVHAAPRALLRGYGPDLTGLFLHDGGAFGIKTAVSFRLMEVPAVQGFAAFAFADLAAASAALSAIARAGIAEEVYVLDPATTGATDLPAGAALRTARALWQATPGFAGRLALLRDVARGGQRPVPVGAWALHLAAAGSSPGAVAADLARARQLATRLGGREVAATIARVARADRFTSLDGVLDAGGERWAAINTKTSHSAAPALLAGFEALLERRSAALATHGVTVTRLASALGQQAFSFEVVFHWRDTWLPLHVATLSPARRATLQEPAANPGGRSLVAELREETMALFRAQGAVSNQLGRSYPFLETLAPETAALLQDLKLMLDPDGVMNPGVLGLGHTADR